MIFLTLINRIPVLRIQLILMQIRIRILDPHWKNMDPDMLKLDEPFRNQNNFKIFFFPGSINLADPTDPDPKHYRVHRLKYLRSMTLCWQNIGIRKSEFVANTLSFTDRNVCLVSLYTDYTNIYFYSSKHCYLNIS